MRGYPVRGVASLHKNEIISVGVPIGFVAVLVGLSAGVHACEPVEVPVELSGVLLEIARLVGLMVDPFWGLALNPDNDEGSWLGAGVTAVVGAVLVPPVPDEGNVLSVVDEDVVSTTVGSLVGVCLISGSPSTLVGQTMIGVNAGVVNLSPSLRVRLIVSEERLENKMLFVIGCPTIIDVPSVDPEFSEVLLKFSSDDVRCLVAVS